MHQEIPLFHTRQESTELVEVGGLLGDEGGKETVFLAHPRHKHLKTVFVSWGWLGSCPADSIQTDQKNYDEVDQRKLHDHWVHD